MPPRKPANQSKKVEALKHEEAKRKNIPTAEYQSVMAEEEKNPVRVAYERRNRDLDPQLVWRGKDEQDWSDLVVHAPPLYIQEKVHPKVLIDDLLKQSQERTELRQDAQLDLFADFNGLPKEATGTDFYQHDANWTNRMILGDSLQVMASLAEREGLRGKVQCIYLDPPYGIKFNSNFQWSTTSRDVKDGKVDQITREPEQVKAFRDTWRDGIHSYLTYLRDRLTVARDLLSDSGSIFVQIGDENVHRVRGLMDEVFGDENFICSIAFTKTTGFSSGYLSSTYDQILWYSKSAKNLKYRQLFKDKNSSEEVSFSIYREAEKISKLKNKNFGAKRLVRLADLTSQGASTSEQSPFLFEGSEWLPSKGLHWKTTLPGMKNLALADRVSVSGKTLAYIRFLDDFAVYPIDNIWQDTGTGSFTDPKVYVVQTATKVIQRCILMTTDPGDLVLDPTCGSGTTAYVAEQWGRRWITIDTSRLLLSTIHCPLSTQFSFLVVGSG